MVIIRIFSNLLITLVQLFSSAASTQRTSSAELL